MNTPILFLLGALALSMLGGLVVWLASRPRKERFGATIDSFSRDLDALAPPGRRRRSAGATASRQPRPAPATTSRPGPDPKRRDKTSPRPGPRVNPRAHENR